jgi:potassium efflux system protein
MCGAILYRLALRWFMIKKHKLALTESLERRRERQEATAAQTEQQEPPEVVSVDDDEEEELDLESMDDQTRDLLGLLFSLFTAIAVILLWREIFPLVAVFDSISIPLMGGLTLLGLIQGIVIAVVTYITVQNLPGLLELAVLRTTKIETGTRHAITTLCQYGVTALGVALVLGVLHVDWAQFGWIAAALSVGLGFGLQEVLSNFVCGLILLFECPVRVGDIITVEGMTGTVTRIRMRATTLINWDRQELVVPNKTLVTGTLMNWTLSAPINRVIVPVGVAYGTDTEEARQILVDVAADHPLVLDEPPPMATFEEFADSSLTLRLRVYVPNLDNRWQTISDLHTEIDKRFAAAGIEIAFPQRDLHLRSGWEGPRGADAQDGETRERAKGRERPNSADSITSNSERERQ